MQIPSEDCCPHTKLSSQTCNNEQSLGKKKIPQPHSTCQTNTSGQFGLDKAFREWLLAGVLQSIYVTKHKENALKQMRRAVKH